MEVVVVVVGRGIISRQYISISFDVSAEMKLSSKRLY